MHHLRQSRLIFKCKWCKASLVESTIKYKMCYINTTGPFNIKEVSTFASVSSQVSKVKSLRCGSCTAKASAWISSSSCGPLPTTKDTHACHESWEGQYVLRYTTAIHPSHRLHYFISYLYIFALQYMTARFRLSDGAIYAKTNEKKITLKKKKRIKSF